MQKEFITKDGK